jgi:hypothetical protein
MFDGENLAPSAPSSPGGDLFLMMLADVFLCAASFLDGHAFVIAYHFRRLDSRANFLGAD